MRLCLAFMVAVAVCAALFFGALPASAKTWDSQDNFLTDLDSLAAALKAQSERALNAASNVASRAVHDGTHALAEAETNAAQQFQKFRETLNARKAKLDKIGEDAAARFKAWKRTFAVWLDAWPETWTHSMRDVHRSATEVIDRFHDWLKRHSATAEPPQIPV